MSTDGRDRLGRADYLLALAAGIITFVVYVRTMYPGLIGLGDAAKFSFVGKVLGTPHAPGNPLYVMVSHVFSYVPWGSLAHRMHGLSAVCAAIAVGIGYFLARELGGSRIVAFSTAIALGWGRVFWSKALYAKGYTLTAAIVTAGMLMLIRWGRTRRRRDLYWAIGLFAASAGSHLIVVALVPVLVIYVLLTDRRVALSPRTILVASLLIALGLSQYGFVLIRTWQHAPYLEASATNLRELWGVITADRWTNEIGAYSWSTVVATRGPLLTRMILEEFGWPCLLVAAAGLVLALRHRWRDAVLLSCGAACVVAMTATMSSDEDGGFLLNAFVLLWPLAAIGFQRLIAAARGIRWEAGLAGSLVVLVALPTYQLSRNYRANDHHGRTIETRYFNALFEMLPDRAAIIADDYGVNMMVLYKLLGEGAAKGRDITLIPRTQDAVRAAHKGGYQVFAFQRGQSEMHQYGVEFEPVQLFDLALPDYLQTVVPENSIVVVAAMPGAASGLLSNTAGWQSIGSAGDGFYGVGDASYVLVGVKGAGVGRAAEVSQRGVSSVTLPAATNIASTAVQTALAIKASASPTEAAISVGDREYAHVTSGAVIAVIDARGRISVGIPNSQRQLRIPFTAESAPFRLARLINTLDCSTIGNLGWQNVSSMAAGGFFTLKIDNYRAFLSTTTVYVAGDGPWTPAISTEAGRGTPSLTISTFQLDTAPGRQRLEEALKADRVSDGVVLTRSKSVIRLEIAVNDEGDQWAGRLRFGGHPTNALINARVDLDNRLRATVCGSAVPQR